MPNTSYKYLLEIACFDFESCILAERAGADRIEFCENYSIGGVTPSHENILKVKGVIKIPFHVIIRPRGGNFVYSEEELQTIEQDIAVCKMHGVDGVVFGVLKSNNTVDFETNRNLLQLAQPMSVTFHRAIDECIDIDKALNEITTLGFDAVLSSGGEPSVLDGIDNLKKMQNQFGKKINIIAGGGIRSSNIKKVLATTDCVNFHSAAIMSGVVQADEIKCIKDILKNAK